MEKVQSFKIDHTKLKEGLYIFTIQDGIITYDIRMVQPNTTNVMKNAPIHTLEHLLAFYLRNSSLSADIIYVGPMGCRTGFYFLTKTKYHPKNIGLIKNAFKFIVDYQGEILGASPKECGNYKDHDLKLAQKYAKDYSEIIKEWKVKDLNYE